MKVAVVGGGLAGLAAALDLVDAGQAVTVFEARPKSFSTLYAIDLGAAAAGGLTMLMPQLIAWRSMYGAWMVNSYEQEIAFTWQHPHLLDILWRTPSRGLVTVCSIFIASRIMSAWPFFTASPAFASSFTTRPGMSAVRRASGRESAGS